MKFQTTAHPFFQLEPLEARIAPALILTNPLADIVAGSGKTGAEIDLSEMFDASALYPNRTLVEFTTNVDIDPVTPGLQPGKILIELFDDATPLTVQNFLNYVNSKNSKADYDNTIIHRSFDFGAGSGAGIDIIQGGGFETFGPGAAHVLTGPEVHNEYSNLLPNVRGTVAMAKTSLSPHTATSEWFFNVTDNTSILGAANNGGFTVFGRVVSGMDVVDAIAGLGTFNAGGATTNLPLQKYNADPDNNPSTPAPTPTKDQLIRIVDATVVPSTGATTGVTFSVESIVPVGATPSDLLTGSVKDQTLTLKYNTHRSGFADVTVRATPNDGSEPVFDTFRVDVRPNLIVNVDSDGFHGILIPGDSAKVKLHITNTGAGVAQGTVDIQIGLAKMRVENGALVFNMPLQVVTLATLNDFDLNLAGGKTKSFSPKVNLLTSLATTEGEFYGLIVRVAPEGDLANVDHASGERFSDDNIGFDGGRHELMNRFGTFTSANGFGSRTNAVLTYGDADAAGNQTLVTWSMKGGGYGRVTPDSGGGVLLETFSTDAKSTLSVKVGKGATHAVVERAQFQNTIGKVNLGNVDLVDYLFAAGGVKSLTLGDVNGQATILIGAYLSDYTAKTTLKFGRVLDLSLESSMPVATLSAIDWRDTPGTARDSITTLGLTHLKITGARDVRGDFEADLTNFSDEAITSIKIAGFLKNATIQSAGDIKTVTLGGMDTSALFAGVSERPDAVADFADAHTIKNFTIKGIRGYLGDLFIASHVAAAELGSVKVKNVATDSGTGDFGFVADVINRYSRTGFVTARSVTEPGIVDEQGNYLAVVL